MLLVGDVGGTKTHLAIVSAEHGPRHPVMEAVFRSADYASLESVARGFLRRVESRIDYACIGVAGPVLQGRATITNLPWQIEERKLQASLGLSQVHLLNDLEAIAYSVPHLVDEDKETLVAGDPLPGASIAIIAPGTGLGQAYLTWDGTVYRAHPTEGGHCDFAPTTREEIGLLQYLQERLEHVSVERVCSGLGLPSIYSYYRDQGFASEPAWLREQLAAVDDPTPIIVANGLDKEAPCKLCVRTLETFTHVLAREASNLTLKVLALGGLYIAGGLPPRLLPLLRRKEFHRAFTRKGPMSGLMQRVPLHVITNPAAAILGAAYCGLQDIRSSAVSDR